MMRVKEKSKEQLERERKINEFVGAAFFFLVLFAIAAWKLHRELTIVSMMFGCNE